MTTAAFEILLLAFVFLVVLVRVFVKARAITGDTRPLFGPDAEDTRLTRIARDVGGMRMQAAYAPAASRAASGSRPADAPRRDPSVLGYGPGPDSLELLGVLALTPLAQDDPDFDSHGFVAMTAELFSTAQRAVAQRDLTRVRPHMADRALGLLEQRVAGLSAQAADAAAASKIDALHVLNVERQPTWERVVARVFARGAVIGDGGSPRSSYEPGDVHPLRIQEQWSLVRWVISAQGGETVSRCPNCGAPLEAGHEQACAYCGTALTGRARDWGPWFVESISPEIAIP